MTTTAFGPDQRAHDHYLRTQYLPMLRAIRQARP